VCNRLQKHVFPILSDMLAAVETDMDKVMEEDEKGATEIAAQLETNRMRRLSITTANESSSDRNTPQADNDEQQQDNTNNNTTVRKTSGEIEDGQLMLEIASIETHIQEQGQPTSPANVEDDGSGAKEQE